jgi:5-methylthioadenosine/S-adenosylhomocysteine deaminase
VRGFEETYAEGVAEAVEPPLAPGHPPRELVARLAPRRAVGLRGCILTPERALDPGVVVVEAGEIVAVQEAVPEGVDLIDAEGVVAPGLIDLHGHPEFNVFGAWEPPRRFANRYEWRKSDLYHELIRAPQDRLLAALPAWTQLRYAEIRALVGGVTAIQGSGQQASRYQDEALVRNVDKWIFGGQIARSIIDLPWRSAELAKFERILAGIRDGSVRAFYVHLAEGSPSDAESAAELDRLEDLGGLTEATVVIHGTALSPKGLGTLRDAGAKLVWSPQSNLRLYGETTDAALALELGVPVGLGADWLPSGSTSLLAELKVARRCLAQQTDRAPDARKLVDMVTRDAAEIAGLGDRLGTLAPRRPADLILLERLHDDPWESVLMADPSSIDLVMIGGDVAYGRDHLVRRLLGDRARDHLEPLLAWGKPMLLDTSYRARPTDEEPPTLARLRSDLVAQYPRVGPIFA